MYVPILIPRADGHSLSRRTMHGIVRQDVHMVEYSITRPRSTVPREGEAAARNALREFAFGDFTVMMDSDVVMTSDHDVSDAIAILRRDTELDAVAFNSKTFRFKNMPGYLRWRADVGHVMIAWVCYRTPILKSLLFRTRLDDNRVVCNCIHVNKDIRIRYGDDRQLIEERRE